MPYGVAIDIRFPLCFGILKPVKFCFAGFFAFIKNRKNRKENK